MPLCVENTELGSKHRHPVTNAEEDPHRSSLGRGKTESTSLQILDSGMRINCPSKLQKTKKLRVKMRFSTEKRF